MLKQLAAQLIGNPPLASVGRWYERQHPLVLLYHGVSDQSSWPGIENCHGKHVPAEAFANQLQWLKRHFDIVPLAEIEKLIGRGRANRRNLCAITFDDGYQNNVRVALPLLQSLNLPATFFLTGQFIDQQQPLWIDRLEFAINHGPGNQEEKLATYLSARRRLKAASPEEREKMLLERETAAGSQLTSATWGNYAPLTWSDARALGLAGMSIGAHTLTHPILSRLAPETQRAEIIGGKQLLESHLGPVHHFAYPNGQPGDWDHATFGLVREAGWPSAWTTIARRVRPQRDNPLLLPRVTIAASHTRAMFRALASGLIPR